jgi:probable rRNA maturation factor
MGMSVILVNRQRARKVNLRMLKQIADALLADLKIADVELGVYLVAAPEMTQLNEKFLRHQGSTDVITFNYTDNAGQASRLSHSKKKKYVDRQDACPTVHGEIFICVDEAVEQTRRFRTNWQSEIVRYLVHGVLHLRGYDDSRPGERRKMKQAENRLLRQFSRRFSLAQLGRAVKLSPCKSL